MLVLHLLVGKSVVRQHGEVRNPRKQSQWLQSGPQGVSFSFFQVAMVALVIQQQKLSTIFKTWLLCWSPISQPTYYQLTFLYLPLLPLSPASLL